MVAKPEVDAVEVAIQRALGNTLGSWHTVFTIRDVREFAEKLVEAGIRCERKVA